MSTDKLTKTIYSNDKQDNPFSPRSNTQKLEIKLNSF